MRSARLLPLVALLFPLVSASRWCPGHWLLFSDRCVAAFPVWASWGAAEALCSQSDSHLVSIRSHDDVVFVGKMAAKLGVPVWTGGYYISQSESWIWSDGSDFTLNVCANHTKNHSAPLCLGTEGGEVKSAPCGEMRFYICSRHTSLEDHECDGEAGASSGLSPGVGLVDVMWGHSDLVAEEILGSSSFLLQLRSGSVTQSCYDRFSQQEALYMGLVYKTLEACRVLDSDLDVESLLLHTKELYKTKYSKQDPDTAPRWLQWALQSFHSVVVDEPLYLLVALSARSYLNSFVLVSVPVPGSVRPESKPVYQSWRAETERELLLTQRFTEVLENHQHKMDVYKSINIFREHLMNQKKLHRYIECAE